MFKNRNSISLKDISKYSRIILAKDAKASAKCTEESILVSFPKA